MPKLRAGSETPVPQSPLSDTWAALAVYAEALRRWQVPVRLDGSGDCLWVYSLLSGSPEGVVTLVATPKGPAFLFSPFGDRFDRMVPVWLLPVLTAFDPISVPGVLPYGRGSL
ncbi:hypothetical protein [Sinosporangium siamense]|uniref:Uncharacterized protein n=1 Tax=Sinosporangium siamense TaxID=1367973 RepID=A0A919RDZ4_9ACTN|nr:hypothetical protein [Sinosporangium siamense]GII91957.1 hypothetical protein Ssi02_21880 [Sinosporangium siamense]